MQDLIESLQGVYHLYPFIGNILFIDVETTGFEKDAKLIEIGAISAHFDGMDVTVDTFETLINPGFQITPRITEVTKITNQMLKDAPGDEVYQDFAAWINKVSPSRMVAHNAKFDYGKLAYNLARVGLNSTIIPSHILCTMQLSRKNLHDISADNLKVLSEYFGYQNQNPHRALSDTETCAYIFCQMVLRKGVQI